ncbi:MAG: TrmH family RNA methyltransferase [Patescibacteria group bacterium]|jgi:tRNA G18 (ribose-2'-O)-methylase SpoU
MNQEIYVICNNIRSLINVGTIFRTCDALGVKKLYLCGLTGYPKLPDDPRRFEVSDRADKIIKKTALEGYANVAWECQESALELIKKLKTQDVSIIALEQTTKSLNYIEANYKFPLAIVIGHEREGLDQEIIDQSDLVVEIPMLGKGKSLNVATSLGILGYRIRYK